MVAFNEFDFRSPHGVRMDRYVPAAPDGVDFIADAVRLAERLGREHGEVTASMLRKRCETMNVKAPSPALWGGVWARLAKAGWRRDGERTSKSVTRNGAREAVWVPPSGDAYRLPGAGA